MRRSASVLLVSVTLLSAPAIAQADAGTTTEALPSIRPPLGHLQDVMDPPVKGSGVPAGDVAVRAQFPGCPEPHAFYLSRALTLGAATAGEQISQWLTAQPAVKKQLFGTKRDPLTEAVRKARTGMFFEGRACEAKSPFTDVALTTGDRITARQAPPALCKLERGAPEKGGLWLFANSKSGKVKAKDFTGAVSFLPPAEGAKKPCLPRLSIALFDDAGKTRLLYHADYNGAVEVEVLGDGCQHLVFAFDAAHQVFVPTVGKDPLCRAAGKAK